MVVRHFQLFFKVEIPMDVIPIFVTVRALKEQERDGHAWRLVWSQRWNEMLNFINVSNLFLNHACFSFFLPNRLQFRRIPAPIGGTHHPGAEHAQG